MAVQKKNKEIPQRKKDLTFGYVRNCEKEIKQNNVPMAITYLCLRFWNVDGDEFDKTSANSNISFEDDINGIKLPEGDGSGKNVNAYLLNVVSSGIHIWKFKQNNFNDFDEIGIVNVEKNGSSLKLEGEFCDDGDYALKLSGKAITSHKGEGRLESDYDIYYKDGLEDDDTIEMTLNMTNLSLHWRVNYDAGREIDIKKGEYRAVVSLYHNGGECIVTLLSYRHIV